MGFGNWLDAGLQNGITEIRTAGWPHPAAWGLSDHEFFLRMPRAKGVTIKKRVSRLSLSLLEMLLGSLVDDWSLGTQIWGGIPLLPECALVVLNFLY
jgi:hypothetical protein